MRCPASIPSSFTAEHLFYWTAIIQPSFTNSTSRNSTKTQKHKNTIEIEIKHHNNTPVRARATEHKTPLGKFPVIDRLESKSNKHLHLIFLSSIWMARLCSIQKDVFLCLYFSFSVLEHIWMECSYRRLPDIWAERGGEPRKPPERKLLLFLVLKRSLSELDSIPLSSSLDDKRFSITLSHVYILYMTIDHWPLDIDQHGKTQTSKPLSRHGLPLQVPDQFFLFHSAKLF